MKSLLFDNSNTQMHVTLIVFQCFYPCICVCVYAYVLVCLYVCVPVIPDAFPVHYSCQCDGVLEHYTTPCCAVLLSPYVKILQPLCLYPTYCVPQDRVMSVS
jgi:hypothetical protein